MEGLLIEIGLTGLPKSGGTPGSNRPAFNCLDQIVCINAFLDHSQLIFKRCGNFEDLIPCSEYLLSFFIFSFYFDTLR